MTLAQSFLNNNIYTREAFEHTKYVVQIRESDILLLLLCDPCPEMEWCAQVLEKARDQMMSYEGCGMSVMGTKRYKTCCSQDDFGQRRSTSPLHNTPP